MVNIVYLEWERVVITVLLLVFWFLLVLILFL